MNLAAYMRLDPIAQIQDLKDISEAVREYTDRELFKDIYGNEGDYTINNILQDSYLLVLEELSDIGINFTIDDDTLVSDWYTAKLIYCLAYIFSTVQVQTWIIKEEILSFTEELLSTKEIENTDILQAILEKVVEIHKGQMEYDVVREHIDEVVSTEKFKEYMQSFITWAKDTDRDMIFPDTLRARKYIDHINGLRTCAKAAVEKILNKFPGYRGNIDQKKLDKLLADYDLDKLSPSEIHIYSLVDGIKDKELPMNLAVYKEKWMDIHHARSPHHVEYWYRHDETPTIENLMVIAAHYSEPGVEAKWFWNDIDGDLSELKDILNEQQMDIFLEMCEAIYPKPNERTETQVEVHIRNW